MEVYLNKTNTMKPPEDELILSCHVCLNKYDLRSDRIFIVDHDEDNKREKMYEHMKEEHTEKEIMDAATLEEL